MPSPIESPEHCCMRLCLRSLSLPESSHRSSHKSGRWFLCHNCESFWLGFLTESYGFYENHRPSIQKTNVYKLPTSMPCGGLLSPFIPDVGLIPDGPNICLASKQLSYTFDLHVTFKFYSKDVKLQKSSWLANSWARLDGHVHPGKCKGITANEQHGQVHAEHRW